MKKSPTRTIAITVLGATTLITLSVWVYIMYTGYSLKNESFAIENEIALKTVESSYLDSLKNALKSSKTDLNIIHKRFIDKEGVPQFIDLLETKASLSGVKVDFGAITITTNDASKEILRIRMSGSGSWIDVIDFIHALESLPYASKIENVNISKSGDKTGSWGFSLDFIEYIATP